MAEPASYTEPHYVLAPAAAHLASELRPITLHPTTLVWLNTWLDELLFLALSACPSVANDRLILPLTAEAFKSDGLLRVLPNSLGKEAVLEAELALRELLKNAPALRRDHALKRRPYDPPQTAELQLIFEELRVWVEEASALGKRWNPPPVPNSQFLDPDSTQPMHFQPLQTITNAVDLNSLVKRAQERMQSRNSSSIVTPVLAIYASTALAFIGEYIVKALAAIVERDPGRSDVRTPELWAAMGEDENLWDAFEGMRTRYYIERDLQASSKTRSVSSVARQQPPRPSIASVVQSNTSRNSRESSRSSLAGPQLPSNSSSPTTRDFRLRKLLSHQSSSSSKSKAPYSTTNLSSSQTNLERSSTSHSLSAMDEDILGFEKLISSSTTMKVSLTPNRLKTMADYEKSRSNNQHPSFSDTTPKVSMSQGDSFNRIQESRPFSSDKPVAATFSKKLTARAPRQIFEDDDDDDDDDFDDELDDILGPRRRAPKTETLRDILASEPPDGYSVGASGMPPGGNSKLAKLAGMSASSATDSASILSGVSSSQSTSDFSAGSMSGPARSRSQPSLSKADALLGNMAGGSSISSRLKLQPKDERSLPTSSSRDLVEFLESHPPPPSMSRSESISYSMGSGSSQSNSSKKSGRLKNIMNKLGVREPSEIIDDGFPDEIWTGADRMTSAAAAAYLTTAKRPQWKPTSSRSAAAPKLAMKNSSTTLRSRSRSNTVLKDSPPSSTTYTTSSMDPELFKRRLQDLSVEDASENIHNTTLASKELNSKSSEQDLTFYSRFANGGSPVTSTFTSTPLAVATDIPIDESKQQQQQQNTTFPSVSNSSSSPRSPVRPGESASGQSSPVSPGIARKPPPPVATTAPITANSRHSSLSSSTPRSPTDASPSASPLSKETYEHHLHPTAALKIRKSPSFVTTSSSSGGDFSPSYAEHSPLDSTSTNYDQDRDSYSRQNYVEELTDKDLVKGDGEGFVSAKSSIGIVGERSPRLETVTTMDNAPIAANIEATTLMIGMLRKLKEQMDQAESVESCVKYVNDMINELVEKKTAVSSSLNGVNGTHEDDEDDEEATVDEEAPVELESQDKSVEITGVTHIDIANAVGWLLEPAGDADINVSMLQAKEVMKIETDAVADVVEEVNGSAKKSNTDSEGKPAIGESDAENNGDLVTVESKSMTPQTRRVDRRRRNNDKVDVSMDSDSIAKINKSSLDIPVQHSQVLHHAR